MLKEFKAFLLRGNVVDLAVAVVIGAAFKTVIDSLVADIITPIIAAIGGQPDFSALHFTINDSRFSYGNFINVVVAFVIVAAAIFFIVVKPMNAMLARRQQTAEVPTTRPCPQCLAEVPIAATRCQFCTQPLPPV